jgi:hypothetical protein
MLTILSLGAGVQSTTVALLSKHGELPPIDCAIFADTGWEPKAVYRHLDWLEGQLPFPVHRVSAGTSIREKWERTPGTRVASLPMFTEGGGRLWRQCTKEWKIEPIHSKIRELLGLKKGERAQKHPQVEHWYGISLEEADRMRDSGHAWIHNRYPLVFDTPMTRHDCLKWLRDHDYPEPSRSACIGCPFHSNAEWRAMKRDRPEEFQDAVDFESRMQSAMGSIKCIPYLHRSCVPLDQVDFSTAEERGQMNWIDECTGMCGN